MKEFSEKRCINLNIMVLLINIIRNIKRKNNTLEEVQK